MKPNSPIPNRRAAAAIRSTLITRANEQTTHHAAQWYRDAAALLAPDRWPAVSARPTLAGRLCQAAAGLIQPPTR